MESPMKDPIRVLYVDDNKGIAILVKKRLEREGFEVHLAYDGEDGINRFRENTYDLLAVDQSMPRCDGLEMIRRLSHDDKLPPTIMVTGTGNEHIAVEAMKSGAKDYITKDIDNVYLDLLPTVINQVLLQDQLQKEKNLADRSMRESETKHRLLLNSIQSPVLALDDEMNVLYCNEAFSGQMEKPINDLQNQNILSILPRLQDSPLLSAYRGVMKTGKKATFEDTQDDHIFSITIHKTPWGILSIAEDITQQKHIEEKNRCLIADLKHALKNIRTLRGLMPICASCKKIRDDKGYWHQVEAYIVEHTNAEFTHGFCPACAEKFLAEYDEIKDQLK
jgi:CheY-like chemotaxis protein